jgi:hypothetical protein
MLESARKWWCRTFHHKLLALINCHASRTVAEPDHGDCVLTAVTDEKREVRGFFV